MHSAKRFAQAACLAASVVWFATDAALADQRSTSPPSAVSSQARKAAAVSGGAAQSMISGYRRSNGLPGVSVNGTLMRLAQAHARAMAASDTMDHGAFQQRIRAAGIRGVAAENIGVGYNSLAEAFAGWSGSSGHSANMLNPSVSQIGIGAAVSPSSRRMYWCLVLAGGGRRR